MSDIAQQTNITGEVPAHAAAAQTGGLSAFLGAGRQVPLGLIVIAFIIGNILSPLYEHVAGPLINAYVAARNDNDTQFIREFNIGLAGPQATNQSYLIAYFAREYLLAEGTTKSIQNRCSVAQTIITYAQDPAISQHANMLYAMPASVADDVEYAQAWRSEAWYQRPFAHDPSCFIRIGKKIDSLRTQYAQHVFTATAPLPTLRSESKASNFAAPLAAAAVPLVAHRKVPATPAFLPPILTAASVTSNDGPATGQSRLDWNTGPTPGSVVGGQILKVTLENAHGGQILRLRNTTLSGEAGLPLAVQLACRECAGAVAFDPSIVYRVLPVRSVHTSRRDRLVFIPSRAPLSFVWQAHEISPADRL